MKKLLGRLKLWQKIVLVISTFALPLGVLAVLVFHGFEERIEFAELERQGNEYQRAVEAVLEMVSRHQLLAEARFAGDTDFASSLGAAGMQVDGAFERLGEVHARLEGSLEVTAEALGKRGRTHAHPTILKQAWDTLERDQATLSAADSAELHLRIILGLQALIAHVGDLSNLILDPDLDSYYVMDATLVVLPQCQLRLREIMSLLRTFPEGALPSRTDIILLAGRLALLRDVGQDRVAGDVQTALREDERHYGKSESMQAKLPSALADYLSVLERFLGRIDGLIAGGEGKGTVKECLQAGARAHTASFVLWDIASRELEVLLDRRLSVFQRLRSFAVTGTLVALLVSSLLAYVFIQSITRPVNKLRAASAAAAEAGDLTQHVIVDTSDEVGQLGQAFNDMIRNLHEIVVQVEGSRRQVNASSREIGSMAQEQQASAGEIAATTTQIGATSKEISATSKELARTMHDVGTVAEQTAALAGAGRRGLSRMDDTMRQLLGSSSGMVERLGTLKDKASKITTVLTTITKVADQTNLLSLNSAIEAEKAGVHGRGFAVVAAQIRHLANQTAVAARDIEMILREIQAAVVAGVVSMDKVSSDVRQGTVEVEDASRQLGRIIEQVEALSPRLEGVKKGMESQSQGAEQISEALEHLTEAAAETVASWSRSCGLSADLAGAVEALQSGVSRFKI